MMLKQKIKLTALFIVAALGLKAQTNQYQYQRELKGITTNWHSLQIPNQVFKNAQSGLEDLRIYGVKGKDTIEVPFILEQSANQVTERETTFNIINQTNNQNGYYYTFQASAAATLNQIKLSFKQTNFDWKVTLEGSNNNTEWFTVLKDYRILSIKNNNTDYQFTQLNFADAKYAYFRICVKANKQPELNAAKILKVDTVKGIDAAIPFLGYQLQNDAKNKQTLVDVNLGGIVPLSYLKLNVQSDFDFYRTFRIEFATDSFKTDKGMQYNYASLYEGTLSSLEKQEFHFASTLVSKLRITIENNDNKPLLLNSIVLKGPVYELMARFEKTDYNYVLYYGKKDAIAPSYELKNFENKIPIVMTALTVGEEKTNPAFTLPKVEKPLFENKLWLWCLMGLIISLLGFFAYKMLKS
jgi:hypothetical protein